MEYGVNYLCVHLSTLGNPARVTVDAVSGTVSIAPLNLTKKQDCCPIEA